MSSGTLDSANGAVAGPGQAGSPQGQMMLGRSQLLVWTGQQLNPDAPLYNMAFRFDIEADIDPRFFSAAFQLLIDRCDALRTVFTQHDGLPVQQVMQQMHYRTPLVDLSGEQDPQAALGAWLDSRCRQMLDLGRCSFDSVLLRIAENHCVWFLNQHHLTMDAWSTSLIYRRVSSFYTQLVAGREPAQEALPGYADYLRTEHSLRDSSQYRAAEQYWEALTADSPLPASLYACSPDYRDHRAVRLARSLGAERTALLRQLAAAEDFATLSPDLSCYNLFATALYAYLWRVSGCATQIIGTPAHNRASAAFRETVGLFIELFPMRVKFSADETFRSLHAKVSGQVQAFMRNALPGVSSAATSRLINVVLNYINVSMGDFGSYPARSTWLHAGSIDPNHDLRLQVHDFSATGSIHICFDFNTSVIPEHLHEPAVEHFLALLDVLIADPGKRIAEVCLVSETESRRFLEEYNCQTASIPNNSFPALFDEQCRRSPDSPALYSGDRTVSYAELSQRSVALARRIVEAGVGPGALVGIHLDRSIELVTAILAVFRAGAAYIPLDSALPGERLQLLLQDTAADLVLTSQRLQGNVAGAGVAYLDCGADTSRKSAARLPEPRGEATAYVIYTSGSTGRPKGVMVSHAALAAYVTWAKESFAPQKEPCFPLYSSIGFDLTVTSLFVPLVCGGSMVIYPEDGSESDLSILKVFREGRVDSIKLTPAHLRLVSAADLKASGIRTLVLGGEDLRTADARRVHEAGGGQIAIFNEYGPTEAVVGCMRHRFNPEKDTGASVPIGVPADGVRVYLLDDGMNPVPEGVAGELYIGGDRIAQGYLGNPALDNERFIPDPFRPGGRMYRSGDRARFNQRLELEYLGRDDRQVKIKGVRVEPAEVEEALLRHPAVQACVVSVSRIERRDTADEIHRCSQCGLASSHPGVHLSDDGVCNICRDYDRYRQRAASYFGSLDELRAIFRRAQSRQTGRYDCIMLLSGGKDSTYALYQVARVARSPLALTLDNGFISDTAKANIGRVVDALGIDHRYLQTQAMNAIFVDSLQRHSNVCHGCFKTLYTLAVHTAVQEGIPLIVTGLSRGQFFETRLTPVQFQGEDFDIDSIDRTVLDARKAYHRIDDAVSRLLDVSMFTDDALFEKIEFVDFYRYSDVSLEQMYAFLEKNAPWIRPGDTGRSTNCLINDAGIYVHRRKEGYHNYALPYSWDVRLGHKQRESALDELNDRIDVGKVQSILEQIGYHELDEIGEPGETRLAAYYTARVETGAAELRTFLADLLPAAMVPATFSRLEQIPLTVNGKVDYAALPDQRPGRPEVQQAYREPGPGMETDIAQIWREILGIRRVGADDNFFELGGDSIAAIQIAARARQLDLEITTQAVFLHQSVAQLALATNFSGPETASESEGVSGGSGVRVEQKELDKLGALLRK